MNKEVMTVCEALDERDMLREKIEKKIKAATFVACVRKKDTEVKGMSLDKFQDKAKSEYQSIMDMIHRYNRIDAAILESNANSQITTRSGKTMSMAAAISLRSRLKAGRCYDGGSGDLEGYLLDSISSQVSRAVDKNNDYKSTADRELNKYKENMSGRDGSHKLSEDEINASETLVSNLYGNILDPMQFLGTIEDKQAEHAALLKELETAIKLANARTTVEF